jgi:galactokinase/mevalonate kinase-like predicted kinase
MKQKLQRSHAMTFRVTEEEREMIRRHQAQTGIINTRAYLLKMAINGRVIHIELESVHEMNRLLGNATNNINQIAKRANETGNIYAADFNEVAEKVDEIWVQQKSILRRISNMMDAVKSGVKL